MVVLMIGEIEGRLAAMSNVLDRDFFQIFAPILGEANLFFALRIELGHDVIETLLESRFEHPIIFISGPDDGLVVQRVLHLDVRRHFVVHEALVTCSRLRSTLRSDRSHRFAIGSFAAIGFKLLLEVHLEDRLAQPRELPRCSLAQIGIGVHGHKMLDVFVLFLDDLITREHYKVLPVDKRVEKLDQGSCVVEEYPVKLH